MAASTSAAFVEDLNFTMIETSAAGVGDADAVVSPEVEGDASAARAIGIGPPVVTTFTMSAVARKACRVLSKLCVTIQWPCLRARATPTRPREKICDRP
jgi:hypothetical protein